MAVWKGPRVWIKNWPEAEICCIGEPSIPFLGSNPLISKKANLSCIPSGRP